MRKIIPFMALLVLVATASAQTTETADAEFGARLSASIDRKIAKGLHVSLEEEVRMDDNLGSFNRFHTTVSVAYKPLKFLRVGLGYAAINPYDSEAGEFKAIRHRLMVDATGICAMGVWQLSLKERVQMTHRTGDFNTYQSPRNTWMLKSRLMLKYRGMARWTPFAAAELRHSLNAATIDATYDGTTYLTADGSSKGEAGWFLDGFNDVYLNRMRFSLGTSYRLGRHHELDVALMADYNIDRQVDANAKGTKLKSYVEQRGLTAWLSAGYTFSF